MQELQFLADIIYILISWSKQKSVSVDFISYNDICCWQKYSTVANLCNFFDLIKRYIYSHCTAV